MPRKKKAIYTIDAETDPFEFNTDIAPFVWGFFDGDNFVYFWGTQEEIAKRLYDYLATLDECIIYAHNGGKFDYYYLVEYFDPDVFIVKGRIIKATMHDKKIEFRDSWSIIPIALSEYDKIDIEYWKMKKEHREQYKQEIINYLKRDCISLYELVIAFVNRFGSVLTVASTGFKELKKTGYDISRTDNYFDNRLRPYYYGGRTQCFETGSFYGKYLYYDINSAYSFAMYHNHWYGSAMKEDVKLPEKSHGSWFATIKAVSRGCLPFKYEGKLYYPDDDVVREYYATGWEIQAGLETGTLDIKSVEVSYTPILTENFQAYIDFWFAEKAKAKENGDDISYWFAKFMQNAPYGKFAQDGREFEKFILMPFGDWPENDRNWDSHQRWKFYADLEQEISIFHRSDPQYKFYNVATSASITGFVRAYNWRNILKSVRPLYMDTDSLICKEFNGDIGLELGQWDLEAEFSEIHIAQRKMYGGRINPVSEFGPVDKTKVASKGVRLTFDQIKDAMKYRKNIMYRKDSPAFNLKFLKNQDYHNQIFGIRYFDREINFEDIEKNMENNPIVHV